MCQFNADTHYNAGVSSVVYLGLETGVLLQKAVCGSWHQTEWSEHKMLICSPITRTLMEMGEKGTEKQKAFKKASSPNTHQARPENI